MKKLILSCLMISALIASSAVMAQDVTKKATPAKAKTEVKAKVEPTKEEVKKDAKAVKHHAATFSAKKDSLSKKK
ncbi:hypothetical protein [Parabacteroides sp. Marseille-P3160]|uniref:hypothetical protein n=1 Tax=Parabacteroides sp. Marseille-P3160 TaxID=1917887 RepID=UPI0009BB9596|nr:hypothetical protein [Parabacteroides sp. Marseille-P3160]